jgi:hypothetical protein
VIEMSLELPNNSRYKCVSLTQLGFIEVGSHVSIFPTFFQPCQFAIPIFTFKVGFLPCCHMSTEEIATVAVTNKVWWTDILFFHVFFRYTCYKQKLHFDICKVYFMYVRF